jgi:hypothetical protein
MYVFLHGDCFSFYVSVYLGIVFAWSESDATYGQGRHVAHGKTRKNDRYILGRNGVAL